MTDVLFDLETMIKQWLGLVPSVEVEAKKPEPEKIEPEIKAEQQAEQQEEPATYSHPTKKYPAYSPMSRTKMVREQRI